MGSRHPETVFRCRAEEADGASGRVNLFAGRGGSAGLGSSLSDRGYRQVLR